MPMGDTSADADRSVGKIWRSCEICERGRNKGGSVDLEFSWASDFVEGCEHLDEDEANLIR